MKDNRYLVDIVNIEINMDGKCKCGRYGTVNNGLCLECCLKFKQQTMNTFRKLKNLEKNQKEIKNNSCISNKNRLYL